MVAIEVLFWLRLRIHCILRKQVISLSVLRLTAFFELLCTRALAPLLCIATITSTVCLFALRLSLVLLGWGCTKLVTGVVPHFFVGWSLSRVLRAMLYL